VFHGPTSLALEHFSSLGFICEEHDNPADFILDVINECEKQVKPASITGTVLISNVIHIE
jgi:ATP-binding cassette subfamily G (WHITE) protein 2